MNVTEATPNGLSSVVQFPVRLASLDTQPNNSLENDLGSFQMPQLTAGEQSESDSLANGSLKIDIPTGEHGDDTILTLYRDRELFKPHQYAVLRKIYATRFELQHGDQIRQALSGRLPGSDGLV